jgi:hypothetical protein
MQVFDYVLVGIFILCVAAVIWLLMQRKEHFELYSPNRVNHYAKYKYKCAYPCGYHRYQSNTCDPQQDELPITMPNPNAALPPLQLTKDDEMMIGVMNGSQSCGERAKLNFCQ